MIAISLWVVVFSAWWSLLGCTKTPPLGGSGKNRENNNFVKNSVKGKFDELVRKFSYVMDLSLKQDREVYDSVMKEFPDVVIKCEASEACVGNAVKSVLRGMYDLYSHVTKDQLAAGLAQRVGISLLEDSVPWAGDLLNLVLRNPFTDTKASNCSDIGPLHLAALFRLNKSLWKILSTTSHSYDIDCKSSHLFDFTPLHIAIVNHDIRMAKLLLSFGADVCVMDSFNRTAAALVSKIRDKKLFDLITLHNDSKLCPSSEKSVVDKVNDSLFHAKDAADITEEFSVDPFIPQETICPADSIHASSLTTKSFIEMYMSLRKPLIIKGATSHWNVKTSWQRQHMTTPPFSDMNFLIGTIPYANIFGKASERVSLGDYIMYLDHRRIESDNMAPYYIFDSEVLATDTSFYNSSLNRHPEWLEEALSTRAVQQNKKEGEQQELPSSSITKQFYMGPTSSGAPHHYHCDSINTLVHGKKRWFLLPPAQAFYTNIQPREWLGKDFNVTEGDILSSSNKIDQYWTSKQYQDILELRGISGLMGICDQAEGDIMYMPAFYGHATLNLRESIGLAYEFNRGDC